MEFAHAHAVPALTLLQRGGKRPVAHSFVIECAIGSRFSRSLDRVLTRFHNSERSSTKQRKPMEPRMCAEQSLVIGAERSRPKLPLCPSCA
jgi:hypothetical protein